MGVCSIEKSIQQKAGGPTETCVGCVEVNVFSQNKILLVTQAQPVCLKQRNTVCEIAFVQTQIVMPE